jgi:hypothetical protein
LAIHARLAAKETKDLDSAKDPKDGGVSIEGLAVAPSGDLLIGLRSPLDSEGRAFVARLRNPSAALAANRTLPNLDKVFLLPINGGVRDLIYDATSSRYLILSGPVGDDGPFGIWSWVGDESKPSPLRDISAIVPAGTAPEGLVPGEGAGNYWIVLDEGSSRLEPGLECKDAPPERRSFRAILIRGLN